MGTNGNAELIAIRKTFSEIIRKLDLLLQKNEIDPNLDCWDDGNRYLVVLENAPEYYPRDAKGRYIAFGGTIGACTSYLKTCYNRAMIIVQAGS